MSVSPVMTERNITLSDWQKEVLCMFAYVSARTCGSVRAPPCVLIFKQDLSSPYINVWSFYTGSVSWPRGSSLHTGQMDNQIPVVELVIKNTHGH